MSATRLLARVTAVEPLEESRGIPGKGPRQESNLDLPLKRHGQTNARKAQIRSTF